MDKLIDKYLGELRSQVGLAILLSVLIICILQFTVLPGAIDFITSLVLFGLGILYNKVKRKG